MLTLALRLLLITSVLCDSQDELLSVVVIYRHGDRVPVKSYPSDPYNNSTYWPVGWGQLTKIGKRQHYQLGQWLRNRYDGFLPAKYSEQDIYIRSTDVDRTLMSAEANLAGLYPPIDAQKFNPEIPWQPIPIHTIPELEDPYVAMKHPCPKWDLLKKQLWKTPYFQNITHRNHDLYAYLTRYSGGTVSDLESLEYLYNTLYIEHLYNMTLPEWTQTIFPDKLYPWASLSFATDSFTPELARLKSGLLFNEIITHFRNKTIDIIPARKFMVYSGHDMTIGTVLNTLGAFEYHCPPYASTIMFELRKNSKKESSYVNIFYKNSTIVQNIVLKDCDFDCDFDEFISILKPVTLSINEWKAECQLGWIYFIIHSDGLLLIAFSSLSSLLFIICATFVGCKLCKTFQKDKSETAYMQLPNEEVA